MIALVNDTHANRLILDQSIGTISKLTGSSKAAIHEALKALQEE